MAREREITDDPRDLIETLVQRNKREFACGLVMLVSAGNDGQAVILLPVQMETEDYGHRSEYFYGAYGIHQNRGLIFIQGPAAEELAKFADEALRANSLTEPSQIVFEEDLDHLVQRLPGKFADESTIVNLTSLDDRLHRSPGIDITWREAYEKAISNAQFHSKHVGQRKSVLATAKELIQ